MRNIGLYVRSRAGYLIVTALFWALTILTAPASSGADASSTARLVGTLLFFALMICSFAAVLLLSDSLVKNMAVIALLTGVFLIVTRPFAHPIDEEYHFLRAFDLTNGRFLPRDAGGWVPAGYETYAERGRWTAETIFENTELWFSPVKELSFVARIRSASYLPLAYIPSALGMGLARLIKLPLVWIVLFGRLTNWLFYVGACLLAVSRTEKLRSLVFLASLCTGVLIPMGTVSTDLALIGSAILFIAICFHYCFDDDAGARVRTSDIVLLTLCAGMIASIKYLGYVLILPLVLFLPKNRYEDRKKTILFVAGALAVIAVAQVFALLRYHGSLDSTGRTDTDTRLQISYMLENPLRYLTMLGRDMLGGLYERLLGQQESDFVAFAAIGSFGATLPMLGALLAPDKPNLDGRDRRRYTLYCCLAAVAMQALCCTALYVSWTPVGETTIWSVQPRYTLPFYLLIMLAVSMPRVKNEIKHWPRLISYLTLLNILNSAAGGLVNL